MPEQNDAANQSNESGKTLDSSGAQTSSDAGDAGKTLNQQQQLRDDAGKFTGVGDYRFTQEDITKHDLPTWALGRTGPEVAQLGNTFYQQALTGQPQQQPQQPAQQPQQQPQYQAPPQQLQQSQVPPRPTQDDWLANPAEASAAENLYHYQTQVQPQMQGMQQNNAAMARQIVSGEERDAFDRWGPEIDMYIMKTDPQMQNVQNLRMIVRMVKGEHIDELTKERAEAEANRIIEERVTAGAISLPGGTGGSAPAQNVLDFNVDDLPLNYRELLQSEGLIREGKLTPPFFEFITKTKKPGQSDEDAAKAWWEAAKGADLIISGSGRGLRVEERS